MTLLSEVNSVCRLGGKLLALAGAGAGGGRLTAAAAAVAAADRATFVLFRCGLLAQGCGHCLRWGSPSRSPVPSRLNAQAPLPQLFLGLLHTAPRPQPPSRHPAKHRQQACSRLPPHAPLHSSPRRLVPHALLGLLVLLQPSAFATRTYYGLAVAGMAYMNANNARRAALLVGGPPAKPHAH